MKIKREALVDEYITEALLQLMKKKPFKDISITEICERAGVTRMSFYRNFESKEDILYKKVRAVTNAFLKESGISYRKNTTEQYFVTLFTHMKKQKDLCLALYQAGLIHFVKEEFDRGFIEIYRGVYDDYKSYFLAGGVYNAFLLWMMNGYKESPKEVALKMKDMLEK